MPSKEELKAIERQEEENELARLRRQKEEEALKKSGSAKNEEEKVIDEAREFMKSHFGLELDAMANLENFDVNNIDIDQVLQDPIFNGVMNNSVLKSFANGFIAEMQDWADKNESSFAGGPYQDHFNKGKEFLNRLSEKLGGNKPSNNLADKFQNQLNDTNIAGEKGELPSDSSRLGKAAARFLGEKINEHVKANPDGPEPKSSRHHGAGMQPPSPADGPAPE